MKKLLLILFLGLIMPLVSFAQQRFIEVVATEKMEVEADEFTFEFYLTTSKGYNEEEIAAAAEKGTTDFLKVELKKKTIEQQEKEIRAFLAQYGIADNHLVTFISGLENQGYDGVYFEKNDFKRFTLNLKKISRIAPIVSGLDSLGAERIKLTSFNNSKTDHYKNLLSLKAVQKAKDHATPMVEINGDKLGKVISITQKADDFTTDSVFMTLLIGKMKQEKSSGTLITISYTVIVKFEII